MLKLIITLSGSWVLSHRGDDVLPIEQLAKIMGNEFGSKLVIEDSGLTELVITLDADGASKDEVINKIRNIFAGEYSGADAERVMSIKAVEENEAKKTEKSEEKKPSEAEELKKRIAGVKKKLGTSSSDSDEDAEADETLAAPSSDRTAKCLENINALIGAEEFKALAQEIADIAPQIRQNGTIDVLSNQAYIFSINEGCGLTTYLKAFAELLDSLGINDFSVEGIEEEVIRLPKNENDDPFPSIGGGFKLSGKRGKKLYCVDISNWMTKTNNIGFRRFLSDLSKNTDSNIVIFRVPFVDKEVLSQLKTSLNDLMYVRAISFPPFNQDELQACATVELKKYGFTMAEDAWEGFHVRIAEEKRDGKFYGINTIKKVVVELLYKKQLSNARVGSNDTHITYEDISAICSTLHETGLSGYDMLDRMVGGEVFKEKINEIVSQIEFARSRGDVDIPCIHMRFVGNPGTGKTTVARIVGKILKEKGILRIGGFFEYAGRDFCGRYIGETAPKTAAICRDAYGSVLFIDEAYSLFRGDDNDRDFGREALDTLIAEMENHRTDMVVIMAGYTDEMNTLMAGNAGLASRMPYIIEFPNFTREQLYDIYVSMLSSKFEYDEDMLDAVKAYFMAIPDSVINSKEFSNARFVRNLFERSWAKASMRCQLEKRDGVCLTKADFDRAIADKEFCIVEVQKKAKIGFVN